MATNVLHVTLTAAGWAKLKPSAYADKSLDKALKVYEAAAGKEVFLTADTISAVEKRIAWLKSALAALEGVIGAAQSTAAALNKLAKKEEDDKAEAELKQGAGVAEIIAQRAGKLMAALR
jgi:hypothetical protein